jgi:thiamine biosynthesis lipoprotein
LFRVLTGVRSPKELWFAAAMAITVLLQAAGCSSSEPEVIERAQLLMGMPVSISIVETDRDLAHRAADLAFREIGRIEKMMSTYLPESGVSVLNRLAGKEWVSLHPEIRRVIREALRYSEISDGAFDITFKSLAGLWRFEPGGHPPSPDDVKAALPLVDYRQVLFDGDNRVMLKNPGMAIGLGGIAKGYAMDRAADVLQREGITNAIVNAGGDIRMFGRRSAKREWRVGIQDPRDKNALIEDVSLSDGAVATSGDYERFYIHEGVRYHHILDPRTGFPARGCRSVTVISETAMMADGLATAVFVLGPEKGLALIERVPEAEAMVVSEAGEIIRSAGFNARGGHGQDRSR